MTYTEQQVIEIVNTITDLCYGSTVSPQIIKNALREAVK